ncbi:MAG: SbcC/MukB-like Walker B domain-containing protein [Bacteroidota bacterium]|nr:SbcC/MukB-like Walker B domain-containing protein [Bacteroidota bacterium]
MIPIKLTLQGLYSYQQKQTIDFTRLTEAHLFGIFGSVGSGKSTVLEAITFALYGKTDRLNLSGDNRNYNMMNLKSSELFIDFVFSAGKPLQQYQVTVKAKRNSKRFEDVRTLERAAYVSENGSWIPVELGFLEEVIGLSYENFKRTIIIPQGKFQEFLQLGNKDRTQMMKELFNLGDYDLYYKVVGLESKNKEKKQNLEGQLQQLGDINPQQVKENKNKLSLLELEIVNLEKELKNKQYLKEELNQLKILFEKREVELDKLEKLNKDKGDIEQLEKKIIEYEKCAVSFKALFYSFDKSKDDVVKYEKLIAENKKHLSEIAKQIDTAEKDFAEVKKEYQNRDVLKQKAEELKKIKRLFELDKESEALKERSKKGETILENKVLQISTLKEEQNDLKELKKRSEGTLPNEEELAKVKEWYTKNSFLLETAKEIEKEYDSVVKEEVGIKNEIQQLWQDGCFKNIPETESFGAVNKIFEAKIDALKRETESVEKEIEHFSVQTKLEEYADKLHDGEECPLCGSKNHPNILGAKNVSKLLKNARKKKREIGADIVAVEKIKVQWNSFNSQLELKQKEISKLELKQKEQEEKIEQHKKLFLWEKYSDESKVSTAFAEVKKLKEEIRNYDRRLENGLLKIETSEKEKQKYDDAVVGFKQKITGYNAEISTLKNLLELLDSDNYINKSVLEIELLLQDFLNEFVKIGVLYEKLDSNIATLKTKRGTVSGSLEANMRSFDSVQNDFENISNKIAAQLNSSQYKNADEVREILAQKIDLESEKRRVEDFKWNLKETENLIKQYVAQIGDRQFDGEKLKEISAFIVEINENLSRKNKEHGAIDGEIKKLEKYLQKQKELVDELEVVDLRGEDFKTMKGLFKASGFVNYVSSVHLQNLCNAANERFYKLTRQKLSLEITEENNFQVRDFMNGGKVRSVKTLSGGQTFQAALSLALALADNIQKITDSNENFFFLDEGFGALDKESLDVVFETLKSLRKESRIVGVISHVEEMQQEIDTHLKIVNHEDRGSIIERSWKN